MRGRGGRHRKRKVSKYLRSERTEKEMVQGVRNGDDRFWSRDSHPLRRIKIRPTAPVEGNGGWLSDRRGEEDYEEPVDRFELQK